MITLSIVCLVLAIVALILAMVTLTDRFWQSDISAIAIGFFLVLAVSSGIFFVVASIHSTNNFVSQCNKSGGVVVGDDVMECLPTGTVIKVNQ